MPCCVQFTKIPVKSGVDAWQLVHTEKSWRGMFGLLTYSLYFSVCLRFLYLKVRKKPGLS